MSRPLEVNKDMDIYYQMADYLFTTDKTLKDIFNIPQKYCPNNEAFIYENNGKTISITYKEYKSLVNRYAKALKEQLKDIPSDSYVALKISNSIEWPLCFWGLIASGYCPLLLNYYLDEIETNKLMEECSAKAILVSKNEQYNVLTININKLSINDEISDDNNWANEVLFCTSGTTSDSRVFGFTGENLSYQLLASYNIPLSTSDMMYIKKYGKLRHLLVLPLSHIFGFVGVLLWFTYFGQTIVFPNSISSNDIVYFSKKYKVSHIFAVPLFWESLSKNINNVIKQLSPRKQDLVHKMIDYNNDVITKSEAGLASSSFLLHKLQKSILGSEIRFTISGGSYISKDTLKAINGINYHLYNGYGMTEIGVTSVELSKEVKQRNKGSVGKAFFGVEYKIINNELCVKSKQIHTYRFVNGKKLNALLDKDGYFHTGDLANIDEEGYVYIKGKIKDVIISSNGENVYPEEIEKKFVGIDNINKCVVIFDETNNKGLTLLIELSKQINDEEYKHLENDVQSVIDLLPNIYKIHSSYISLKSFPINTSLKIKRYVIIDNFKNHKEDFVLLNKGISKKLDGISEEQLKPYINEIIDVFAQLTFTNKNSIGATDHFIIDLGGDSFTYMSLISSIEEKYNIEISSEEIGKLNTPIEFAKYVYKTKNN